MITFECKFNYISSWHKVFLGIWCLQLWINPGNVALGHLFRKSFLEMSGDPSGLAYLESGSYLAGRRFIPGLTIVTVFPLVCCLKCRSNIGIEMRNHLIFPSYMGMTKGQILKFPLAGAPTRSISFHLLILYWCRMESAPGVQGAQLD